MFTFACGRSFVPLMLSQGLTAGKRQTGSGKTCAASQNYGLGSTAASNSGATLKSKKTSTSGPQTGRWMRNGLARKMNEIVGTKVEKIPEQVSSSADKDKLLCSYNWVKRNHPTIFVPGGAPVWKNIQLPATVTKDSGVHFIDQKAARVPQYPFEVAFKAVTTMSPEFRFDDVDVVVNRNSLRNLLDFCYGRTGDSFRINLFVIHNTLIIEGCERSVKTMVRGSRDSGYGHNFETSFTEHQPSLENSTGHYRFLQYKLGNLNCVVGFEVDGCYTDVGSIKGKREKLLSKGLRDETSTLVNSMASLELASDPVAMRAASESKPIALVHRGTGTRQSEVAELKSKTTKRSQSQVLRESMPQLWFGRTPFLITGFHEEGIFATTKVTNTAEKFAEWEQGQRNQAALRKMVSLLAQLRDCTKSSSGKACAAVYERHAQPAALQIYAVNTARKALPDEVIADSWARSQI